MITKKRLQKLIEQKATIYDSYGYAIKLGDGFKIEDDPDGDIILRDWNNLEYWERALENLFETKEEAEWNNEIYAEEIISFNPPIWEKIKYDEYDLYEYRFYCNNKTDICRICVNEYAKEIDVVSFPFLVSEHKRFKFSKEGYKQAVKYARKMFLGKRK